MSREKYWSLLAPGAHLPRLWLVLSQEHLLIGWENISRIRATVDFLSLSFECEHGIVQIDSPTSLQELFENLQVERVWKIDGTKLKIRLLQQEE